MTALNPLWRSLSESEQATIVERTRQVTARVALWAERYAVFEPVRFPAVAVSMAAAAPWCDLEGLAEMAMIPIWIYAIDDAYDRRTIAPQRRHEAVRRYTAVAAGAQDWPEDPYAASLADITARLARRPLWEGLRSTWVDWCRRMLTGMAFECDTADAVRAGAPPPTLRSYLAHGLYSVGALMYLAGAWIIDGDAATPAHLPELAALARLAGRTLRLANDLRTYEKEQREGNYNALLLLGGPDPARAVRRRMNAYLRRLVREGERLDLRAARLVTRVSRFSIDLYTDFDYHTIPHDLILGTRPG